MSPRRRSELGVLAGVVVALAVSACGSSTAGDGGSGAGVPGAGVTGGARPAAVRGRSPVAVTVTGFPRRQHLAAEVGLRVAVRNAGHRALPDVAVTICERSCAPSDRTNEGTAAQAFGYDISAAPNTADPSRPLWIVETGPGGCRLNCNQAGGSGGGVTAASNTWALGRLAPGATARFDWRLDPVVAGSHTVTWQVAGDLTGAAPVVGTPGGGAPHGTLRVAVGSAPPRVRVTPTGRVVTTAAG